MIKAIIFDLGNVLVNFDHNRMIEQIAKVCNVPASEIFDLAITKGLGISYERGEMTTDEVYKIFRSKAGKEVAEGHLFEAIGDIFQKNEKMEELVHQLKAKGYKLLILSNTCEIHIEKIRRDFTILQRFEAHILSYEIKARKPEDQIYKRALELAGFEPEECLYIDDVEEYATAARKLGMKAIHFQGYEDLVKKLKEMGIFD